MTISAVAATLGLMVFPLAMIYAGAMDLFTLKIRNKLVLAIAGAWLLLAPLAGFSLVELGWSVGGAALAFACMLGLFALGWIGGGDAKLAAAAALWFQPQETLLFFIYTALLGGVLTLIILQLRARMLPVTLGRVPWIAQLHDSKTGVPYGAAMAPAALIVMPHTGWLAHAAL
jgi:prepilin peptidase CpaA